MKAMIAGIVILLALGGCREPSQRIVLIPAAPSPFWQTVKVGVSDAGRDLGLASVGLEAVVEASDGTVQGQLNLLRKLAAQPEVIGVAIAVADPSNEALSAELKSLRKQGVAVITVNTDVDRAKYSDARAAFVGTNHRAAGVALGAAARGMLPEGGGFATFVPSFTSRIVMDRVSGFAEGAGATFEELDSLPDDGVLERMQTNVRGALLNHGEKLKVLVGVGPENPAAIAEVARQENKRDQVVVLGFDADPKTVQLLGEGAIDATVVQNPYGMGYESVRLLAAMIVNDEVALKQMLPNQGQPDGDLYWTTLKIVVPDIGSPLSQETFGDTAAFFRLSEFRQWLYQRNLSGS